MKVGDEFEAGDLTESRGRVFLAAIKMPGTAAISRLWSTASKLCQSANLRRGALCCRLSLAISASVALSLWAGIVGGLMGLSKGMLPWLRDS
jgi:hypothetical protein